MNETSGNQHQVQTHNIYEEFERDTDPLTVRAVRACAAPIRLDKELASTILNSKFVGCNGDSQEMLTQILRLPFVHCRPDGSFKYSFNARCYFDEQLRAELTANGDKANDGYSELNQFIAEYFRAKKEHLNGDAPKGSYLARQLTLSEAFHMIPADAQKGMGELGSFAARSRGVNSLADTIAALNISKYRESSLEGKECLESNFIKAKFYIGTNKYDKALPLLEKIYSMYMSPSYESIFSSRAKKFMAAVAFQLLGYIQLQKGEIVRSIKILRESIDLGLELEEWYHAAFTMNTLGKAYIRNECYDDAIGVLEECVGLVRKKLKNNSRLVITLNMLGEAYIKKKKKGYSAAINALEESVKLSRELEGNSRLVITLSMLGYAYLKNKRPDDAEVTLRHCLELADESKDARTISTVYSNLGEVYTNLGCIQKAIEIYDTGAEFNERNGDMRHALDKQEKADRLRRSFRKSHQSLH